MDLQELERQFGTEDQCLDHLFHLRWKDGYRCPRCQYHEMWQISAYYNRFTVQGTAASRVFFRIIAKAVRMRAYWPDDQCLGLARPLCSLSASLSFAAFDLCR